MNIITKAVQDVMYEIPEEVLREVFVKSRNGFYGSAESMESLIITKVVQPRVVPDASIAKGEHMTINLAGVKPKILDNYRSIYEIPHSLTGNKRIISTLSVSYAPYNGSLGSVGLAYGGVGPMYSRDVATAAQQMVEASSAVPNVSTSRVEIVGHNTIMIEDSQRFSDAFNLECYVVDDNYMSSIDPRDYEYFSQLVAFAVKSYIYRTMRIRMGRARIEGGSALSEFKEVVDEYADAETNYRTFLRTTWAKVAFMSNRNRYGRFIRSQVPIGA